MHGKDSNYIEGSLITNIMQLGTDFQHNLWLKKINTVVHTKDYTVYMKKILRIQVNRFLEMSVSLLVSIA